MADRKIRKERNLDRANWVAAARETLVAEGIAGISLRRLAEVLGATILQPETNRSDLSLNPWTRWFLDFS